MEDVTQGEQHTGLPSTGKYTPVGQSCPSANLPLSWLSGIGHELIIATNFLHGVTFWLRYHWRSYNLVNLDRCITCWQRAFQLRRQGHLGRTLIANSLGSALSTHFYYSNDPKDIDGAIESFTEALNNSPVGHRYRVLSLNNLGGSLQYRYTLREDVADIDLSIKLSTESLELCRPQSSRSFSAVVRRFFLRIGAARDVDDYYPLSLINLGDALVERYQKSSDGDLSDMQRAMGLLEQALELCPTPPSRCVALRSLASAFRVRFSKQGDSKDINRAVELEEEVLSLSSLTDPYRPSYLKTLGVVYLMRYQASGNVDDIQKAVQLLAQVMDLRPKSHPRHYIALNSYAGAHFLRYQALGVISDLHMSIQIYNESADVTPPSRPIQVAETLLSLSAAIQVRLDQFGILDDIRRAVMLARRALALLPTGHFTRIFCLVSLAGTELAAFAMLGDIECLERAIQRNSEAQDILSEGHPSRGYALNSFGKALTTRYDLWDNLEDLENAIKLHTQSLEITAQEHHWRGNVQSDLGCALLTRYRRLKDVADVENAIALHRGVLADIWPLPHPQRCAAQGNLAEALLELYQISQDRHLLDEAMESYKAAASYPYVSARTKMIYVTDWLKASQAHALHDQSSLAYSLALDFLPQMMDSFAHLDSQSRLGKMRLAKRIPRDAAVHAILYSGGPNKAIELIEQGRGMFWNQGLKLRTPFDGLPEPLQQKLKETTRLLEVGFELAKQFKGLERDTTNGRAAIEKEKETNRRRQLVDEFDELVKQARQIKGFEHLLMPKPFQDISRVAKHGPVVVLLASAVEGCAAILIRSENSDAVHIPLPNVTVDSLEGLVKQSNKASGATRSMMQRNAMQAEPEDDSITRKMVKARVRTTAATVDPFDIVLAQLWKDVVDPVIKCLGVEKPSDVSQRLRLWWCPTGPFVLLPIHAAGINFRQANCECASDYIVSSYTPTLRALLDAQDALAHRSETPPKALIFAQPSTPGLPHLPNTLKEIDMLSQLFPRDALLRLRPDPSLSFTESNSSIEIAQAVDKLADASILHLACHGNYNKFNQLDSGFALQDGVLSVDRLIKLKTPHAFFAFLSACETAMADQAEPDESIHLAGAMLFAGFQSVVATMWMMGDSDGPEIARNVYQRMLEGGVLAVNPDVIAFALDEGVRKLRDRDIPPSRWAPYIHMGV